MKKCQFMPLASIVGSYPIEYHLLLPYNKSYTLVRLKAMIGDYGIVYGGSS